MKSESVKEDLVKQHRQLSESHSNSEKDKNVVSPLMQGVAISVANNNNNPSQDGAEKLPSISEQKQLVKHRTKLNLRQRERNSLQDDDGDVRLQASKPVDDQNKGDVELQE
jgi:hypothetical protein